MPKLRKREPEYEEQVSSSLVDVECWTSCRYNVERASQIKLFHANRRFTVQPEKNEPGVLHRELDLLDVAAKPNTRIVQCRVTGGLTSAERKNYAAQSRGRDLVPSHVYSVSTNERATPISMSHTTRGDSALGKNANGPPAAFQNMGPWDLSESRTFSGDAVPSLDLCVWESI